MGATRTQCRPGRPLNTGPAAPVDLPAGPVSGGPTAAPGTAGPGASPSPESPTIPGARDSSPRTRDGKYYTTTNPVAISVPRPTH
jgi:hypothetical protein